MARLDRLSALISRFDLHARVTTDFRAANLLLMADPSSGELCRIELWPVSHSALDEKDHPDVLIAASINMGGYDNPLARALPCHLVIPVKDGDSVKNLALLILEEIEDQRCGRHSTLQRLFEVLVVMLLRQAMRENANKIGLIAGLYDQRICKAIIAIHERPEFDWHIEDLADVAGLSRSQFMECFKNSVGQTPAQYLREWRLTLARQDLLKGERVKTVALRYGYGSQEALSRAFHKKYQCSPAQVRLKGTPEEITPKEITVAGA